MEKLAVENPQVDPSRLDGSGKDGRVTKGDMLAAGAVSGGAPALLLLQTTPQVIEGLEKRVRMTGLRRTIARRLKEAQNTAAILTTYNEADMSAIKALRATHQDAFVKKYGTKLGFMSFFVAACCQALKDIPAVNAEIEGDELIYKNYYTSASRSARPQASLCLSLKMRIVWALRILRTPSPISAPAPAMASWAWMK